MNRDSYSDDLSWTAFRYVADELSAEEAAAFEVRLADDQQARDAVVRTVQLTGAMAAAIPQSSHATVMPSTQSPGGSTSRRRLVTAIALSCLVLFSVMAIRAWLPAPDPQTIVDGSQNANDSGAEPNSSWASHLISLWVSADSENAEVDGQNENDGEALELQLAHSEPSRDLAVPDWLVIAVSDESDGLSNPGNAEEIN